MRFPEGTEKGSGNESLAVPRHLRVNRPKTPEADASASKGSKKLQDNRKDEHPGRSPEAASNMRDGISKLKPESSTNNRSGKGSKGSSAKGERKTPRHRFLRRRGTGKGNFYPFKYYGRTDGSFAQMEMPKHFFDDAYKRMDLQNTFLEYKPVDDRTRFDRTNGSLWEFDINKVEDIKLPLYMIAFMTGFVAVVAFLVLGIIMRLLFFRPKTDVSFDQLEDFFPEGGQESCLAERRARNPNLTKIDDYMELNDDESVISDYQDLVEVLGQLEGEGDKQENKSPSVIDQVMGVFSGSTSPKREDELEPDLEANLNFEPGTQPISRSNTEYPFT